MEGVYPLRLKHGFTIDNAWVTQERNEFLWILSYDGPEDWEPKDAAPPTLKEIFESGIF